MDTEDTYGNAQSGGTITHRDLTEDVSLPAAMEVNSDGDFRTSDDGAQETSQLEAIEEFEETVANSDDAVIGDREESRSGDISSEQRRRSPISVITEDEVDTPQQSSQSRSWWESEQELFGATVDHEAQLVHHTERNNDRARQYDGNAYDETIGLAPEPDLFSANDAHNADHPGATSLADDDDQSDTPSDGPGDMALEESLYRLGSLIREGPVVPSSSNIKQLEELLSAARRNLTERTKSVADMRFRLECARRIGTIIDETRSPPSSHCSQGMSEGTRRELVAMVKKHVPVASGVLAPAQTPTFTCSICYTDYSVESGVSFYCSHMFCAVCLCDWIPRSTNVDCPLCRSSFRYQCGHAIPRQQIRDGAEFTREQLESDCSIATYAELLARRGCFLSAVRAGRRPNWRLLLPGDVTPSMADAVAMYHGSWNLGAALMEIGRKHESRDSLEQGLHELERYVDETDNMVEVVAEELAELDRKLSSSKRSALGTTEHVALHHTRQEVYRVLKRLIRSAQRTRPKLESVRDYVGSAGLLGPDGVSRSSCPHVPGYAPSLIRGLRVLANDSPDKDHDGGSGDAIDGNLQEAENDFIGGECNGFIRALVFDHLMRRLGLDWRPVLHCACECYPVGSGDLTVDGETDTH